MQFLDDRGLKCCAGSIDECVPQTAASSLTLGDLANITVELHSLIVRTKLQQLTSVINLWDTILDGRMPGCWGLYPSWEEDDRVRALSVMDRRFQG